MTPEQIDAMVASIPEDIDPEDRAGIMMIANDLRDPVYGDAVEKMYRLVIAAGSWQKFLESVPQEPKTARGAGSGNFHHAGRPGEVGGSGAGTGSGVSTYTVMMFNAKGRAQYATGYDKFGIDYSDNFTDAKAFTGGEIYDIVDRHHSSSNDFRIHETGNPMNQFDIMDVKGYVGQDKNDEGIYDAHKSWKGLEGEPRAARSGNFGHAGRPGHEGGSAPRDEFLTGPKDALAEITAGKTSTIAKEDLRNLLKEAAKRGGSPDLVRLTLEGTPLFAGGLNIARKDMPQISKEEMPHLLGELKAKGISVRYGQVSPMSLLPIQKEINAARVGAMLEKLEKTGKPLKEVLISNDGRVLDGHHRFAVAVSLQTENPTVKMKVIRLGVDHTRALDLLNKYTKAHGIAPQALEAFSEDEEFADEFSDE